MEHLLVGLTAVVALGIAAQWLSWRLHLPSILLLLLVGLTAGALTGFLDPDELLGNLLAPVVSLSVAIILFEGGMSLDIAELRDIGKVVRNLATVGALVTWAGSAAFAYWLLDFDLALSVLFGALLIVTGPTVIGPLLRHIRPDARVGSAVKWEGIVNDPTGAILAVLVFEAIVAGEPGSGLSVAATGVLKAAGTGALFGLVGALALVALLKRHWVPDFLQNPVALAVVLSAFTASNLVQSESGLLTVTVMGSALASQRVVTVQHIIEFKENLRVLLISVLFILLAARVELSAFQGTTVGTILFILALILLVRPASVALASLGTSLNWRERVFLGFMAPRGIVAAAVSSIFAFDLAARPGGYEGADRLIPITFLVIIATVGFYGLSAGPVARRLGVASPNPQGLLLVGAAPWVRSLAHVLKKLRVNSLLVDSNWANVAAARQDGLRAYYGDILVEHIMEELNLNGIGSMLAVTPNDEVNALAGLHFGDLFGRSGVYQLSASASGAGTRKSKIPKHLRGRVLFGDGVSHSTISQRVGAGAEIKATGLTAEFDYNDFRALYGDGAIPLLTVNDAGEVQIFTAERPPTPKAGQTLVSLVDLEETDQGESDH